MELIYCIQCNNTATATFTAPLTVELKPYVQIQPLDPTSGKSGEHGLNP